MLLNDFINIRKRLNDISVESNKIVGTITPNAGELSVISTLIDANCIESPIKIGGAFQAISAIPAGTEIQLILFPLLIADGIYFETFAELVRRQAGKFPEQDFYVNELSFRSGDAEIPPAVRKFEAC